jgi:hypothetical protein
VSEPWGFDGRAATITGCLAFASLTLVPDKDPERQQAATFVAQAIGWTVGWIAFFKWTGRRGFLFAVCVGEPRGSGLLTTGPWISRTPDTESCAPVINASPLLYS